MRRANLRSTDLRESNLVGADLTDSNLQDANLSGARYDGTTRWPVGFDPQSAGALPRNATRVEPQPEPID
jgi:hypothetical protein